jgi:hypothetical protein
MSGALSSQKIYVPSALQEEQLQHHIGGVPLKKTQQTCTFTASTPRGSRAAALLHAVLICSGATNSGACSMHRAFWSTDHYHITVVARRLPGMVCQPSV